MAQWHLYLVENRLGHWYTGISTDPVRRFAEHQSGGPKAAKALKGKGPLTLVFQVPVGDRSQATRAENWVKSLSRKQKQALAAGKLTLPEN